MLGFGVESRRRLVQHEHERPLAHESPGERELLPLPEAQVHALGPRGAQLCFETGAELCDDVRGARPIDGRHHRRVVVEARQVTDTHGVANPELEPTEVLKRAREA